MLHNDRELFKQIILTVSDSTGIDSSIIEKDYYVTMFLKMLVKKQPDIIFKGGTSLSKCHKLIKRFSEDIDLNLECDTRPSEGQRKHLKENIVSVIDDFEFLLTNPNDIRSRRDYNKYIVDFSSVFDSVALKQYLVIETSVFLRAYPNKKMIATSFIYDYLKQEGREDIIKLFELEPFELNVQSIERTFIDKLFAIGDYYLDGKVTEHSRHIYDLYKLYDVIQINDSLKQLFLQVRKERSNSSVCLSAQDNVNFEELLQKIVNENVYKNDYDTITTELLFEKVSYKKAIKALQKIIDSCLTNSNS